MDTESLNHIKNLLNSKSKIRLIVAELEINHLEKIIKKFQAVLDEKKSNQEKDKKNKQLKKEKIAAIKKLMIDQNITPQDLVARLELQTKRHRKVNHFIFHYETEKGDTVEWLGANAGRLPKSFKDYLKRTGKSRYDCIIKPAKEKKNNSHNNQ